MTVRVLLKHAFAVASDYDDADEQEMWDWCFDQGIYPCGAGTDEDGISFLEFEDNKEAVLFKLAFFKSE